MRVHYVLLLAASAFFASVEADAVATDSAPGASTADRLAIAEKNAVSVSRSLRTAALTKQLDGPLIRIVLKGSTEVRKPLKAGPRFRKWLQHMKNTPDIEPAHAAHASLMRTERPIEELYNVLKQTEAHFLKRATESDDDVLKIAKKVLLFFVGQMVSEKFSIHDLANGLSVFKSRMDPNWIGESDAIYSALSGMLGYERMTTLLEGELKNPNTKELAEALQRSQFDDWGKVLGINLQEALSMHGHHNGVDLVEAEQDFLLKYVEHLIKMKDRIPAIYLEKVPNYPNVLTELIAAAKKEEFRGTSGGKLIKRWVQEKLHPGGVSWVLGAKALEEGTTEYWFLKAYRKAFNRAHGKRP